MQNSILHVPAWLADKSDHPRTTPPNVARVIYFIPGNPGLISYYTTFLQLVHERNPNTVVAGASLGGFETEVPSHDAAEDIEIFYPRDYASKIHDLDEQVVLTHERVQRLVAYVKTRCRSVLGAGRDVSVVLMGHSVGAWIALEVVRRHYDTSSNSTAPAAARDEAESKDIDRRESSHTIASTMLLTPTIHDIASSPSGRIAAPVLSNVSGFPALVQMGASTLTSTLPVSWVRNLVARITGMKSSSALDATTAFLRTSGAVKQALHMAGQEMAQIREDRWGKEVWGAATDRDEGIVNQSEGLDYKAPRHYFLFARQDHWVADTTREAILQARGGNARIVVDSDGELGLVHAWCLEQSEMVAGIVHGWLKEI